MFKNTVFNKGVYILPLFIAIKSCILKIVQPFIYNIKNNLYNVELYGNKLNNIKQFNGKINKIY